VHENNGVAVRVSTLFVVKAVDVGNLEEAFVERLDTVVDLGHCLI